MEVYSIIIYGRFINCLRKCRNWQTSKTKDLVHVICVRVQVPSSALRESSWSNSLFVIHEILLEVTHDDQRRIRAA